MFDMWLMIAMVAWLSVAGVMDIRKKEVPVWIIIGTYMWSVILMFVQNNFLFWNIAVSTVPGLVLIVISLLTQKVGIGDGLIISGVGIGIGFEKCAYMVMIALLLCCFVSITMLLLKKVNRDSKIPFIPFITIGMGVVICAI